LEVQNFTASSNYVTGGATQPPAHFHRNPLGCASFGRLLCRSSVKDHSGYSPSSLRASSQNAQQRRYISLVSARASEDERMQAIAGGAVDFLRKPFSEDALFNAIQAALKR
jgi:DNA-binding NarL/FixJ family response regulator